MSYRLIATLISFHLAWSSQLGAQPMSEHLMGKVVSATADIVRIQTADGTVRELHTDAQTRYERSGHPAGAGDLRPGTAVMVDAERMDDHWMARRVQIEGGESTPPSHTETPTAPGQGAHAPSPPTGEPGHGGHPATPPAGHEGMPPGAVSAGHAMPADTGSERNLFQSDMWLMAGMTPRDPMGDMAMPQWRWMTMGIVRLVYNRQGG